MAVTNGWGQAVINNTNGFGKLATNNIGAGSVYENSASGDTALIGTSAAFSYSASSFTQADADPTPTITGTTGGTFSGTSGLVFVSTSTGQIDLSASTIAAHVVTYTVGGVSSNFNLSVTAAPFASTQSFNFDGVDDFISFDEVVYSGAFTFSLWVKPGTFTGNDNFLLGDVNSNAHFIRTKSATQIQLKISGSTVTFTESGGNDVVLNTWQHLMIIRDASNNVKAFRNGASFGSTGSLSGNFEVNAIGEVYSVGTFNFLGSIDEVGIWTSDQSVNISSIYNSGVPNDISSLNPVAWYRMGENSNYKSPQWLMPENSNKDKVSNYSYQFDGVDDFVNCGNVTTLNNATNGSWSLWIKPQATGLKFLFSAYQGSGPNQQIQVQKKGTGISIRLRAEGFSGGTPIMFNESSQSWTLNEWYHIAITFDGSVSDNAQKMKVFVNANQLTNTSAGAATTNINTTTSDFHIGSFSSSNEFAGLIDQFSIFNYTLTQANVNTIYNSGQVNDITSLSPSHLWKLGEEATFSTNWTIPDQVGSNDGTSNNMTIEDRIGDSPNSTNNSVSFNMTESDRQTDVPT